MAKNEHQELAEMLTVEYLKANDLFRKTEDNIDEDIKKLTATYVKVYSKFCDNLSRYNTTFATTGIPNPPHK